MAMLAEHDPFSPITLDALDAVTGGRITQGTPAADPALLQRMSELAQAVQTAGQTIAAQKQQSSEQLMQLVQQRAQSRRG
ncbi:MAG: hypothetical protein ACM31C_15665 [Acidobacteriota bacterium]